MAGNEEASSSAGAKSGSFKHVGNKMKRTELYRKYKAEKRKDKFARRSAQAKAERGEDGAAKKAARLAANKTRTIENTRDYNPTIINAPNTHEGPGPSNLKKKIGEKSDAEDSDEHGNDVAEEEEEELQEQEAAEEVDDDEDPSAPPAILITTSMPSSSTSPHLDSLNARSHPAEKTREFVDELLSVFPGAEYRPRSKAQGVGLGKICGWARERRFGAVLVVGESRKEPFALTVIQLPHGPTAFFRLTSISTGAEIYGKARPTPHTPELILNNFTTVLGHRVGKVLQSLFPKIPQLEGRQAVTCHNQRDYIFFRRHRYMFKSDTKTALQEIGPRFTLKLHSLKESLPKGAGVWDGKYTEEYAELEPEEAEALQRQEDEEGEEGLGDGDGGSLALRGKSASTEEADSSSKTKKRQRGEEETVGLDFQWKPKMSVSRRNFYL